jgi:rod shape-determining protein MreC
VTERRVRALFVLILLGQVVALTSRVPDFEPGDGALEGFGLRLLAPLSSAVGSGARGADGVRQSLRRRGDLLAENQELRGELEELRGEVMRLREFEDEARRLAQALDHARQTPSRFVVGDIVYVDHASWLRTLVVRAEGARLRRNQPVVSTSGLVGRVVVAAPPYAKVQLLTDRAASVGAMIERTRRQGVARGDGEGGVLLEFVPRQASVEVGDRVVTAGIDGVFPRGVPVGTVVEVQTGGELFHHIRLQPAVDFGRLEHVYLVDLPEVPAKIRETRQGAIP